MSPSSQSYEPSESSRISGRLSQLRIYDDSHTARVSHLLPDTDKLLPAKEQEIVAMLPMRVQWECTRAALHHGCSVFEMLPYDLAEEDYELLWTRISQHDTRVPTPIREGTTLGAWEATVGRFSGVDLRCKVTYNDKRNGPQYLLSLDPLLTDADGRSNRFQRAYGSDRFLTMEISHPYSKQDSKQDSEQTSKRIFEWLSPFLLEEKLFLDRIWRVLFFHPKRRTGPRRELYYEAKLFAIRSADTASGGSAAGNLSQISPVTLQQVVDWFIPLERSKNQLSCKLYDRIKLGFLKSRPTLVFSPSQVHARDDRYGDDSPEDSCFNDHSLDWDPFVEGYKARCAMNDGCSWISESAANEIWRSQGGAGPALRVFQGRFLNVKGV